MANETIEETLAKAEKAIEETGNVEEAYQKLTSSEPEQEQPVSTEESKSSEQPSGQYEEDEDDDYELPESYKKETRELFAKLPKEFEPFKKDFAKRARSVDSDRKKFYSEYQSKTAFAQKLAQAINPYLDSFTTRGISPEIAVARAAKLDHLVNTDPQAAAKFIMQMANLRSVNLDDDEVEYLSANKQQSNLTASKQLSQDDIRNLVQQEISGATQAQSAYQSNLEITKNYAEKKTQTGKPVYPDLHNAEFCESMKADVSALVQAGKPYEKALIAAYHANGGRVEQETSVKQQQPTPSQQRDSERVKRLQVASSIRPANSSTNSINLADLDIPDSIEDTFALAEKLLRG